MSDADSTASGSRHVLRLHLQVLDVERDLDLSIPAGPCRLVELLPAARALSDELTAVAIEQERREGREVSCRAGCGSCCRQLVAISYVEAQGLAELVASFPAERQRVVRERFAAAVTSLEAAGLLDAAEPPGSRQLIARDAGSMKASVRDLGRRYFALQIACPFLEREACSIYEHRPSICREHHVTSPAHLCATVFESDVHSVPTPQRVGDLLMKAAHHAHGLPMGKMPLTLSLEWSNAGGHQLERTDDGLALFRLMMGAEPTSEPGAAPPPG